MVLCRYIGVPVLGTVHCRPREGRKISDDIFKPAHSLSPNRLMCLKTLANTPFSPRDDSPPYPPHPPVFLSSSNNYVTPLLAVGDYGAICANPLLHDIKRCGRGLGRGFVTGDPGVILCGGGGVYSLQGGMEGHGKQGRGRRRWRRR